MSVKEQGQHERRIGAAWGLVDALCSLVCKLLLVPIILHYLNRSQFGLYQLIGAFVGYLALIDFGISGTLGRFIARYRALDDRVRQDNVFAMCMLIYSFIISLICLVALLLYRDLGALFPRLNSAELAEARVMFILLVGSISATVLSQAFSGVNAGHERFIFSRVADSICMLGKVGVVAAVLATGHRAIGLVCAEASINAALLLLNAGYAVLVLKVRFRLHFWDRELFGELIRFAFWTFIAALVLQINFRLGSVLLGVLTTTSMVGIYAIALQINTLYNMLPTAISSVFLPRITRLVVANASGEEMTRTIIPPSRFQLMLLGCILGGFVLFGRQFIRLWAGADYVPAWSAALLILVPVTIPLCQNTILSILYAKMLNRDRALLTLAFATLSGVCGWFLIPVLGLYGPALATGMALLLGHGVVMNLYYHLRVRLDIPLFVRKVTERVLPVILFSTAAATPLVVLPVGEGWFGLCIRLLLFLTLYASTMWLYGMSEGERALLQVTFLSGIKGRFAAADGGGE